MSPDRARLFANGVLIAAASVAAYLILSRPAWRRAALNLSRAYFSRLPASLGEQVAAAWMQSGRTS